MIEAKQTTRNSVPVPALGIKLADIYYVIFRKKWLICGFLAAGLIAGLIVYFAQPTLYWSEAKLLVRYVVDTKAVETGPGTQVQQPGYGGAAIINSELEILTSFDLCKDVARIVGADRILDKKGDSNEIAAAVAIYKGLTVESPRNSSVIRVRFVHPDPEICQAVLRQIIESYFERHTAVHRTASSYQNLLTDKKFGLLNEIRKNEEALRKHKEKAGITAGTVEEARKSLSDRLSRLLQELYDSEAQLVEYRIMLGDTNHVPARKEQDASDIGVSREKMLEYQSVRVLLDSLRNREVEMLSQFFTDEHPQLKRVRERIAEAETKRKALETEFPKLAGLFVPVPSVSSRSSPETRLDPARATALAWKIEVFSNQLARVRGDIALLDKSESLILEVQDKLRQDRESYQRIATGLEAAQFDDDLAKIKIMSNIQPVQTPSPPSLNVSQRLKLVAGTFFGLLAAGLALAFVIELLVDHTVRRPGEFETKIHIPLFLSIPKMGLNGHAKLLPFPASGAPAVPAVSAETAVALHQTWDADHPLRRYIDGLRDRILTHFDGDPHKPKLIGVTSCSTEVGVTSIAAGLAGALSETGDGNVLLLNLNFEAQSVHPFYRGELTCGLSDVLEPDKRGSGMVLQNLYVATAGNSTDPASNSLPKQLARVVPKLRVSDYDYIVFDLPPTTPTTMTARLAGLMDLVILVVESEKDTQEAVKEAGKLLSRSKAHVSAVLNKVRNPTPRWLHKGT